MLDGMGRGEPQDRGAGMSAPLFALCIGAAMILFVIVIFAIVSWATSIDGGGK